MNAQRKLGLQPATIALLVGLCLLLGITMSSALAGSLITIASFGVTGAILSGRFPIARHFAWTSSIVGALALLGTCAGIENRTKEENRHAQEAIAERAREENRRAQEAIAEHVRVTTARAHFDAVLARAPQVIAHGRAELERAHSAMGAGNFDEARSIAETARSGLAEVAALVPPPAGVPELMTELDGVRRDGANLAAIHAALEDAREARTSTPDPNHILAWSAHLETLADALRTAPPVARERFGNELRSIAQELDRRRGRYRRDIERAERQEAERQVRLALCGPNAPNAVNVRIAAYALIARDAHDPDSVEVAECDTPTLTRDRCWVARCIVRARNAFGARVAARYEVAFGRAGALEARLVR